MLQLLQAFNLGVRSSRRPVMAFRDNPALADHDGTDRWIRTGAPDALARLDECCAHEALVILGPHG